MVADRGRITEVTLGSLGEFETCPDWGARYAESGIQDRAHLSLELHCIGESPEEATRKNLREFYKMAIPADSIARAIAYAIEQPDEVEIDEIVIRPAAQDFSRGL